MKVTLTKVRSRIGLRRARRGPDATENPIPRGPHSPVSSIGSNSGEDEGNFDEGAIAGWLAAGKAQSPGVAENAIPRGAHFRASSIGSYC